MSFLFFSSFFVLPSAYSQLKTPAPIFKINTSNDVVSRKDMPFGVPKTKLYISTPFPRKTNFWATGGTENVALKRP